MRPPDQDISSTDDDIPRLSGSAHAIPSKGPVGSPPRGSKCSAQETTKNYHSFTHHRKVNTRMGDLSSQDSICRDMVAKGQTLQEQRDNIQAAYEARSNNNDDDTHWGSLSPGELLGLEGWLSWYDTKIADLDPLLIPRP